VWSKPVGIDYTHKKQSGGTGQFGRVKVKLTPGEAQFRHHFQDENQGGNVPGDMFLRSRMRRAAAGVRWSALPIIDFEIA